MDKVESGSGQETIGSVKQAVNFYGGKPDFRKIKRPFSEKPSSRARELHMAKKDIRQYSEDIKVAEDMRSQAESELFSANKTVKDLSRRIEESKFRARTRKKELETLKRPERIEGGRALAVAEGENYQYAQVMRELESVKQDLSKLKLDMACLLENKSRVEKETEASTSRLRSHSNSIEGLKQEIEEANEEQVLVELARMEAVKEFEAIEAEREAEETKFTSTMEKTRKKIKELMRDIDRTKELEAKLAITAYDADVLQNELRPVRAMSGSFSSERNETSGESAKVTEELEAAKKELASIKEEGFQFMASMDIIRNELKHVSEENTRLKELEMKADSTVQNLNHKLLRDKSKLESVSSSEEKTNSIVSNLSVTLQQLTTEAEAAKTEKRLIAETTESIRAEKQKMENEIYLAEETLRTAIQELEEVKASEALALESLKTLSEKTMKDRASAAQHNSTITISQFEFKYLSGRAVGVEEVADKKVAAAQAWIEALKASEKEILMKTEIALREMNELKLAEEQRELDKQDGEQTKLRQQTEKPRRSTTLQGDAALPRKSIREYGNSAMPVRKSTAGRPNSPGGRYVNRSGSITLKRKPKVMPNLVKIFSSTET